MLGPRIHLKAPPPPPFAPPADPAEAFARHAAQLLGSELVACEERFPEGQTHSVLVVVVERDPAAWRERLREGYLKSVGNGQPNSPDDMQLEVVDRFVEEAIQRLCETGILQKRIRATRHLYPESGVTSRLLNDDERDRIAGLRDRLKRKLKMANLLASEELLDEARDALKDAVLFAGRLIAAEARLRCRACITPNEEGVEGVPGSGFGIGRSAFGVPKAGKHPASDGRGHEMERAAYGHVRAKKDGVWSLPRTLCHSVRPCHI
jgi:hypothetical protein